MEIESVHGLGLIHSTKRGQRVIKVWVRFRATYRILDSNWVEPHTVPQPAMLSFLRSLGRDMCRVLVVTVGQLTALLALPYIAQPAAEIQPPHIMVYPPSMPGWRPREAVDIELYPTEDERAILHSIDLRFQTYTIAQVALLFEVALELVEQAQHTTSS